MDFFSRMGETLNQTLREMADAFAKMGDKSQKWGDHFFSDAVRSQKAMACPQCGENNNPELEQCWKCAAPFPESLTGGRKRRASAPAYSLHPWWRIYFWFLLLAVFTGLMVSDPRQLGWLFSRLENIIGFIFDVLAFVALYGYGYGKKILKRFFWKVYFPLLLVWTAYRAYFVPLDSLVLEELANHTFRHDLVMFVFFIPLYLAPYFYSFKSDDIWKSSETNRTK